MGIYEQRKNQHYMLRLRCAGGLVTPEQLAKIAFVGHQLSTSHLHVTTRQEIQIHNVDIEDAIPALKKLEKVGISSAGGGGNTVRNMMVDDRSGLTADEEFDVYPYVEELTSRLIAEKDSFTMPRKYKVAIDTSVATANYSYIADLGLQARIKDGQRGFSGRVGRVGDDPYPAYTIWLPVKGKHEIDLQQGYIAAKKIPAFVEDYLRDVIAEQANYADYYDYVAKRGVNIVKDLIAKYKEWLRIQKSLIPSSISVTTRSSRSSNTVRQSALPDCLISSKSTRIPSERSGRKWNSCYQTANKIPARLRNFSTTSSSPRTECCSLPAVSTHAQMMTFIMVSRRNSSLLASSLRSSGY